ncbi:MAG: proton-conducting transporter membrane subunit [Candidatus Omnitrophota bacterium]|nr:NADH/ubiquinone/plastoquinone (complex I) [Candidatus Omnitrophota bacterium]
MNRLPLFVAVPLFLAFLIPVLGRKWKTLPDILGNLATFFLLLLSLSILGISGVYAVGGWPPPLGIVMVSDGLTTLMLLIVALISFAVTLYSIDYMELYTSKTRYYSLFLLMIAGMNGVIITGDLFNLFVFLEIASIASYALVAFGCQHEELEASFKYLVLGTLASTFILLGIAFMYGTYGTLNLAHLARLISENGSTAATKCALGLFFVGFSLKAALVPFHAWLPDAHPSAPAPISAMLSGLLIKSIGIYALIRLLFNVFGFTPLISHILITLGILSMVVGVFLAIGQWDYKRLLAYHSISQIGYVTLAIGLGTPLGILAGLFHLVNHSVFKSLLFLNAGSVEYNLGTRDMKKMGGLQEKMPVTNATSLVGAFSISGLPPFNGFWSKLLIILACVQAKNIPAAVWAVLVSIITLSSFTKVQRYVYYGKLKEEWKDVKEAPQTMRIAMVMLAVCCVLMGLLILPGPRNAVLTPAVNALLAGREGYFNLTFSR